MTKTITNGTMTKGKGIFAVMAWAVGLIFLLACANQPAPSGGEGSSAANQTVIGAELAGLLSGQGSPALRAGFPVSSTGASNGNTGVWVSGTGEATAAPDLAILSMGVEALADTVSESRSQAAEAMAATIAALQEQGVALEDIQTRNFNISPRYTRREVTQCPSDTKDASASTLQTPTLEEVRESLSPLPEGPVMVLVSPKQGCFTEYEQVLTGFRVTNQLTVKVRDLDNVGEVIDRVADAGGDLTRFQSVSFTIDNAKDLEAQARESAIKNMMAKAQQVASVAGVELGRLVYVTETGGPGPVSFNTSRVVMAFAESAPTPILSGEMKVSITVQGAFEIAAN